MRLSLSELLLIFLIALVLLGPSVLPRMQRWLRRRGKQVGQSRRARAAEAAAAQRDAIASGVAIGAMDALDYRLFVLGESPEVARERVAEIASAGALGVYGEQ